MIYARHSKAGIQWAWQCSKALAWSGKSRRNSCNWPPIPTLFPTRPSQIFAIDLSQDTAEPFGHTLHMLASKANDL